MKVSATVAGTCPACGRPAQRELSCDGDAKAVESFLRHANVAPVYHKRCEVQR